MNEKEVKEKWYTIKEANQIAGVANGTLSNAIRNGFLVAKQISDSSRWGFHYMVSETDLLDWVENRKVRKANAIATTKVASELSIQDIAQEITLRIQKAYDEGFKEGKKQARREMAEKMKEVMKI